ncbi:diguanylate cyclase [Pelovirga terrestris]|uniref:diguanylate cyclase n=1 Tax=Pelovirga terrestris TaxID=2771352 RepID=A0A8J6QUE6_9BACT|nr:diguanylate cyclase [Pelovirga terrestris]MBD1400190.1 diguanylate cyclase [Pelovirga terrestris]
MADTGDDVQQLLAQLQQENGELKQTCKDLISEREALEMAIAEFGNKQLRAEIEAMELEQIFLSVSDAMWAVRDDGTVIRANEAMAALLGKPTADIVGKKCRELLDYGLCQNKSCPLEVCSSRKKQEFDVKLATGADSCDHYIISVAPLTTIVGTTAIISQFKNITARKEAEQQLEELNRALSEMARIDGLTGIANRRFFDEVFDKEWKRLAREQNQNFSLILADIDFFKKYNDNYGHQQGDDCLILVGKALKEAILRPSDMAARYGGEEFALLLPGSDLAGAGTVGERARQAIVDLQIPHEYSDAADHITMSLGGAMMTPSHDNSPADLIALADQALYRAKESGRNTLYLPDIDYPLPTRS